MKFNQLSPQLYTTQLQESVDFYVNVLGFYCAAFMPAYNWARVQKGGADIMLCLPNPHITFDKPVFSGSFYINTTGIDELWETVKDNVQVCYAIENFSYGMREFAIYDNNGYLLQFGEEIPGQS
jgi:uncharacterized glyoxalase superfamily protein PhnB